jgi:hypothetical protein
MPTASAHITPAQKSKSRSLSHPSAVASALLNPGPPWQADHTRDLRAAVERVIRRHGREVVERQFVVARVADMAIELYVRAATLSRTQALLDAHAAGAAEAPPLTSSRMALDDASVERLLRLCDLACQRSGLRFRSARVALNDDRDDLLRSVAADLLSDAAAS